MHVPRSLSFIQLCVHTTAVIWDIVVTVRYCTGNKMFSVFLHVLTVSCVRADPTAHIFLIQGGLHRWADAVLEGPWKSSGVACSFACHLQRAKQGACPGCQVSPHIPHMPQDMPLHSREQDMPPSPHAPEQTVGQP